MTARPGSGTNKFIIFPVDFFREQRCPANFGIIDNFNRFIGLEVLCFPKNRHGTLCIGMIDRKLLSGDAEEDSAGPVWTQEVGLKTVGLEALSCFGGACGGAVPQTAVFESRTQ